VSSRNSLVMVVAASAAWLAILGAPVPSLGKVPSPTPEAVGTEDILKEIVFCIMPSDCDGHDITWKTATRLSGRYLIAPVHNPEGSECGRLEKGQSVSIRHEKLPAAAEGTIVCIDSSGELAIIESDGLLGFGSGSFLEIDVGAVDSLVRTGRAVDWLMRGFPDTLSARPVRINAALRDALYSGGHYVALPPCGMKDGYSGSPVCTKIGDRFVLAAVYLGSWETGPFGDVMFEVSVPISTIAAFLAVCETGLGHPVIGPE